MSAGGEMGWPFVSVVVPHYDDLRRLDRCLAALEAQTYPKDRLEIVVADNMSPAGEVGLRAVIAGRARLVLAPERGAGPARNAGVAASTGEVLAFTDADCAPEPGWLRAAVRALETADVAGGRVKVLVEDPRGPNPVESFELVFAFDNERYVTRKGFTVTANLACRRAVFDAVGGFRVGVSEDLDWSRRATALGYRIAYAPEAVVGHPARASWRELAAKWRRLNAESYGLTTGEGRGRISWLIRAGLLPLSAVVHTPRVLRRADLPARQKLGALGVLYRIRLWRMFEALRVALRPR